MKIILLKNLHNFIRYLKLEKIIFEMNWHLQKTRIILQKKYSPKKRASQ